MLIGDLVTGRSADSTGSGGGGVSVPLDEMDDPGKVPATPTQRGGVGIVSNYMCLL